MSETETSSTNRALWWRPALLMALLLALAWALAFEVTGMLWWRAGPTVSDRPPPPPPAQVHAVDTSWVDLDLYRRSNPQWRP